MKCPPRVSTRSAIAPRLCRAGADAVNEMDRAAGFPVCLPSGAPTEPTRARDRTCTAPDDGLIIIGDGAALRRMHMAIIQFPDPRTASPEGIVAIGGDLHPDSVLAAYRQGIFPWPVEKLPLLWFCPAERGILDFTSLHVPRSLRRARHAASFSFTVDRAFRDVIRGCADTRRPGQQGTWITPAVVQAYVRLHDLGIAH